MGRGLTVTDILNWEKWVMTIKCWWISLILIKNRFENVNVSCLLVTKISSIQIVLFKSCFKSKVVLSAVNLQAFREKCFYGCRTPSGHWRKSPRRHIASLETSSCNNSPKLSDEFSLRSGAAYSEHFWRRRKSPENYCFKVLAFTTKAWEERVPKKKSIVAT